MATIKGKVFDASKGFSDNGLVSAIVYVSDADGKLISEDMRVRTDTQGKYSLDVSLSGGKYITAKAPSYESYDTDTMTKAIPSNNSDVNFDFNEWNKGVIVKDEVVVTASRDEYFCKKNGGTWDSEKKQCKKGLKNWQKMLIGLGVLVVVVGGIYLYKKQKK
jgi:hypothetical protein